MPIPTTTYAVKQVFPSLTPNVIVIFKGLLYFSFAGNLNCEVGVHNDTPSAQRHILDIKVWKKDTSGCQQLPITITPNKPIEIEVTNPAALDGVYVYQVAPKAPFDRLAAGNDPKDYRWALDFDDLYRQRLVKNSAKLRPSLNMNNGLFYTLQRTESQFDLQTSSTSIPIGKVAKLLAANIYLADGGKVELKISNTTVATMNQSATDTFQIDLTNDCTPLAGHCGYHPGNSTKETRNDFYLSSRTFTLPSTELELRCTQERLPVPAPGLCGDIGQDPTEATDPAPCLGGVFGRSTSLD